MDLFQYMELFWKVFHFMAATNRTLVHHVLISKGFGFAPTFQRPMWPPLFGVYRPLERHAVLPALPGD